MRDIFTVESAITGHQFCLVYPSSSKIVGSFVCLFQTFLLSIIWCLQYSLYRYRSQWTAVSRVAAYKNTRRSLLISLNFNIGTKFLVPYTVAKDYQDWWRFVQVIIVTNNNNYPHTYKNFFKWLETLLQPNEMKLLVFHRTRWGKVRNEQLNSAMMPLSLF